MNRLLKIILTVFGILAIGLSLYFTFKLETNSSQTQSSSSKESQKSRSLNSAASKQSTLKNSKTKKAKKKSPKNKKSKKKTEKQKSKITTTQNNLNTNNYITCGVGIQNCPPPKPIGKCECNASQSVMSYFDGNH